MPVKEKKPKLEGQALIDSLKVKELRLRNRLLRKQIKQMDFEDDGNFDLTDIEGTINRLISEGLKLAGSPAGEKLIMSGLFTLAWWKAYGDDFQMNDLYLGIAYGFTVPDALRGGVLANSYALGALSILGVGFLPDEILDWLKDKAGEAGEQVVKGAENVAKNAAVLAGIQESSTIVARKPYQKTVKPLMP